MPILSILDGNLGLATASVELAGRQFDGGACDENADRAFIRAQSEAIERASLIKLGPSMVISRDQAVNQSRRLLAPVSAATPRRFWVPGSIAGSSEAVAVPADVALLEWVELAPLPWKQTSVGTAAHTRLDRALTAGILECLERFAIRMLWAGSARTSAATDFLREILSKSLSQALAAHRLFVQAWRIVTPIPVPVFVALIGRCDKPQITMGAGCALDPQEALRHAFFEAVSVRAALASSTRSSDRFAHARRSACLQRTFTAFLDDLSVTFPADHRNDVMDSEVPGWIEEYFGVPAVVVHLPPINDRKVVKVVVPSPEFLIPRSTGEYLLAPGYLE